MTVEQANVYDILKERGFIQQVIEEDEIREILGTRRVTFYIGFDPTAESLHAGSLMPIMAMMHLQRHGHQPIAILGGGTAMVGDPSGKTEMRKMLLKDTIESNHQAIRKQLSRYLNFDEGQALSINNADWLLDLNYIDFLREIGCHFSVNRMLAAESYRIRLESGLSFLEFNYQLLQAYDFLVLYRSHQCILQMGGDDQWGNIVAGVDLIRRMESSKAYGITFPLLVMSNGQKMGKTASGAIWLDSEKTLPYDFYQYWINVDDRDVRKLLAYFTFLPMSEVDRLGSLEGSDLREAKEVLAYEATKITHGEDEAVKARDASRAAFGAGSDDVSAIPSMEVSRSELRAGINVVDLFSRAGLVKSKSEGRRLVVQGGCYVNDERVDEIDYLVSDGHVSGSQVMLRAGKKKFFRLEVVGE
ncbi:tyrosine--tRNA ligase [candidate division KSB1 bacterium]|nr:tyrosine--tRNA ligase [candidate division KSB1 bacterium]